MGIDDEGVEEAFEVIADVAKGYAVFVTATLPLAYAHAQRRENRKTGRRLPHLHYRIQQADVFRRERKL